MENKDTVQEGIRTIQHHLYLAYIPFFIFGVLDRAYACFQCPTAVNLWTSGLSALGLVVYLLQRR